MDTYCASCTRKPWSEVNMHTKEKTAHITYVHNILLLATHVSQLLSLVCILKACLD